jgi:hypothetical protein
MTNEEELELTRWRNACSAKDKRIEILLYDNKRLAEKAAKTAQMADLLQKYRKATIALGKFGAMGQAVVELLGEPEVKQP